MASLKPVLKNYFVKESGKGTIFIRISHDGKTRYIKTPWEIEPRYMNKDGTINSKHPRQSKLNYAINLLLAEYNGILEDIGKDIIYMDINTLVNRLRGNDNNGSDFFIYADERIRTLRKENRLSYAVSYTSTIAVLKHYYQKEKLPFKEITPNFLRGFESYLLDIRSSKINTVRVYLVNIRAIFNHAIDRDIIKQGLFPFRKFRIRQEKAHKRSLEIYQIQKLMAGPYKGVQQRSVDIFMLIFYLIGINIKDLLYLKPSDLKRGRLTYRRFKTGAEFDIKVFPEAQAIIDKYRGEKYLLSFMDGNDSYDHYKNLTKETNKKLRMAATCAGLDMPISTYFARHSWATIGRGLGISFDDIKQALGHGRGGITDAYINYNMLKNIVDEANRKIIDSVQIL